jgi:hypothetical protein
MRGPRALTHLPTERTWETDTGRCSPPRTIRGSKGNSSRKYARRIVATPNSRLTQPLRIAYAGHLRGFEQRLKQLVALVSASGAQLAIVTQPISYAGSEDARTDRYALFYVDRGEGFVPSPALLARLLGGFNDVSRRVARNQGLPLIDLANELGSCERCFYDQWHFTLEGARRAAERIAIALPFEPESHAGRALRAP